jgi:hypothetical protein
LIFEERREFHRNHGSYTVSRSRQVSPGFALSAEPQLALQGDDVRLEGVTTADYGRTSGRQLAERITSPGRAARAKKS